jgi:hypothetical protein
MNTIDSAISTTMLVAALVIRAIFARSEPCAAARGLPCFVP